MRFSEDKKHILDSSDTLKIERIFPNKKLIFTKRTSKEIENKKRIIYQYEYYFLEKGATFSPNVIFDKK
ncbi:MAG: hypothetical protein COZ18_14415 [Flexibacter sp. CG_4_10_14_3_um_filter_32_15]|nr:MAG: hypothetical protein COZ18_14415 [Flexibacter sp. CG_4_10_14_3_um_filter_32_15]